jgi:hypothetical protein
MNKEQTIEQYMKSLDISREEAEQLWEDDQADFIGEESEQMTQKAKQIRRYEQADKPRAKAVKEKKLDEEKVQIIDFLWGCMLNETHLLELENVEVTNPQKEISFTLGGNEYSISLIKHRKKEV